MQYYLMLISAAALLAVDFVIQKGFQKRTDGSAYDCLMFSFIFGVFETAIFFAANGFKLNFTPFTCIMGTASSVLAVTYIMLGFYIMKSESVAYYTLFVMTGGMTLPYIWGLLFLDEEFSWLRTAGLVIIAAAIVILNLERKGSSFKLLLVCICVFFLNGTVSIISKEHQIRAVGVTEQDFIVYTGIARVVFAGIALLFTHKKVNLKKYNYKAILLVFASSIVAGVSFVLQLIPAKYVSATVVYPFITSGSIIFTALAGRIAYKERITKKTAFGLALCLVGTCMFL